MKVPRSLIWEMELCCTRGICSKYTVIFVLSYDFQCWLSPLLQIRTPNVFSGIIYFLGILSHLPNPLKCFLPVPTRCSLLCASDGVLATYATVLPNIVVREYGTVYELPRNWVFWEVGHELTYNRLSHPPPPPNVCISNAINAELEAEGPYATQRFDWLDYIGASSKFWNEWGLTKKLIQFIQYITKSAFGYCES